MLTASTNKLMTALLLIILAAIFLIHIRTWRGMENGLRRISAPILTVSFKTAKNSREFLVNFLQTPRQLREENKTLRAQLINQEILKEESERLREENGSLLNLLRYASSTVAAATAQIISVGTDNATQTVIIDRGSDDGIQAGAPVIAEKGILIGTILAVYGRESVVELITNNQSKIGARLFNKERSIGIAAGSHGLSVQIEMIPQNEIIAEGDLVVTSGIEKSIPRGLIIGKIAAIKKELSEPFQTARLALPLAFNKISWVTVLTTH